MLCPHCDGSGKITAEQLGFGGMVLLARKAKGLRQSELAKEVGLTRSQIANIEAGRSSVPIEAIRTYAEILGIEPMELIP